MKANKLAVKGEQTVTALEADGAELPCAGVFILREAVAPTDLLPALETEKGFVKVDRRMATNVEGVFAAGDCTGLPLQVAKAVGEGHVAALSNGQGRGFLYRANGGVPAPLKMAVMTLCIIEICLENCYNYQTNDYI